MELSETPLCLYSAEVDQQDGSYVITVPQREVEVGSIEAGEVYRVAMLTSRGEGASPGDTGSTTRPTSEERGESPVESGEVLDVEIEDIGDQGDGIARVGPGYVVIVPDAEMGERVSVEITETRENLAFADTVEHYDRSGE